MQRRQYLDPAYGARRPPRTRAAPQADLGGLRHRWLLLLAALVGFCAVWSAHAGSTLLGELPADWRDDLNRPLRLDSLHGQRLVVTMAYANCHRICPQTIRRLEQLERELAERGATATFVIVGYDAAGDDAQAWHRFRVQRHLLHDNWLFLSTPYERQVRAFADRLGFDYWKYDEHVMHDERVVVIDPSGQLQLSFGPGKALDAGAISAGPG
jgi:cytochrome oxidase Cu insertion factor (SCO1/SenC/PrrC family)